MARVTGAAQIALTLTLLLLTTHLQVAGGEPWDERDEYAFQRERRLFECRKENDSCRGFPFCCGSLSCYWVGGFSPFRPGKCVMCIGENLDCQRDTGCCGGLICDSHDKLNINGICRKPRSSGACYRVDQCLYTCKRPYYKSQGYCTAEPVVKT